MRNILLDFVNVSKYKRKYNKISVKNESLKDKYIELLENKIEKSIDRKEFDSTIDSFNKTINKLKSRISALEGGDNNGKNRNKRFR